MEGSPEKPKNKNQAQNVCTYLTYLHGSHLTPNLGNFSPGRPSIPHPPEREQEEAARNQAEGSKGNGLFLQLVKKYLQLFQVSFVGGQEGRAPRGAGALLCSGQSAAGQEPLPVGYVWERRPLPRGREPNRSSDKTKRKMNTRIFFFLLVFFLLLFLFCFLGGRAGEDKGKK